MGFPAGRIALGDPRALSRMQSLLRFLCFHKWEWAFSHGKDFTEKFLICYNHNFFLFFLKKKLQIFFFFNVGKNSYLYGHLHQVICILGYVKASFIFDLKSSSASTDWILPRQRFWSHQTCLITPQCCAYLLPAHALLLTVLCLYNNYIFLPQGLCTEFLPVLSPQH